MARAALAVLALSTGGFMLIDGIRVLVTGRYFGPPTPGPWRHVAEAVGLDPFSLGPLFVVLGAVWLASAGVLLASGGPIAWWTLLVGAIATLWYLPVGTVTALLTILVLAIDRAALVRSS